MSVNELMYRQPVEIELVTNEWSYSIFFMIKTYLKYRARY